MAQFQLSDAIIPSVFGPYVQNLSTKTNRFIQSGITTPNTDDQVNTQLLAPGDFITLPYINDLEGDPESWTDQGDITVAGLTTGEQRAFKFRLEKAFGTTDISNLVSGANALETIAQRFGAYWNRVDQNILLKTLAGVFSNSDVAAAKLYDETVKAPTNTFGAAGFLGAISLLGDLQDNSVSKIAVNSAVYGQMKLLQMIDTVQPANAVVPINVYNGMQIVVDDDIPVNADGTTTAYVFGAGAVGYATAQPANAVETEREARKQGGRTNIINRRVIATHVNGTSVAKDFTPAGQTVTIDELAKGTTWASITDPRNIKVVAYKAKLDPQFVPASTGSTAGSGAATGSGAASSAASSAASGK